MANSFFLSLLVLFLAAFMLAPQHFAVDAALPKFKPPKINRCSKILWKLRPKDYPPATHF
ncbi:hypothetical protein MtrunA17_Chr3g0083371 [Medicago truncatula]|uniref:Transmembrane protein n=1 Tax=Medicago truncatula TaxID=3880 RepID=A0A396ILQ5_MEDTR|nr:hypothetical protein MtrunA17_Chr3g0083371 [Medicago truncatula]